MANPNPSPSTRFRSGNPGGGRPRGLVRSDDLKRIFGKYWRMKAGDLIVLLKDNGNDLPMGEMVVAKILARAAQKGDAYQLNVLLDRVLGRPREEEKDDGDEGDKEFKLAYAK